MTDKQALRALIKAVEDGTARGRFAKLCATAAISDHAVEIARANGGSLDAAKMLHDALLPGWSPSIGQNVHHGYWFAHLLRAENGSVVGNYEGSAIDNPARAWLIAILKAHEAAKC